MLSAALVLTSVTADRLPVRPWVAPVQISDRVELAEPAEVRLDGFLGQRVTRSERVRLRAVNEDELLGGFRKRPGSHPWIGEHVGKFLHAATLAYAQTGDPVLRAKVVRVARGLIATQEPDGYLGTYLPADRWQVKSGSDWDVWAHKYDLIGLLTYYRYFGDESALTASKRVGDLLIRTFGPGKRSILAAGTHVGMAATSVLEPMVTLYRTTGDRRYLDFARYVVASWEEPGGPDILRGLLAGRSVDRIANGKAYEMLSNLVGLCELARMTGDRRYLRAVDAAWRDVRDHHRYLTGTASYFEHFHPGPELPEDEASNVGETCVTVTWMQLNAQLLRLTGEAKYGAEIERSAMNHLAGAQRPDGGAWCYYTSLEGVKPYSDATTCCLSSGPRGMAMVPALTYLRMGPRAVGVNLVEASRYATRIDGQPVTLTQAYRWDRPESLTFRIDAAKSARLALNVRVPEWAEGMRAEGAKNADGWLRFPERVWRPGETVRVSLRVRPRAVAGGRAVPHRAARTWGPFVLAYDEAANPDGPFASALMLRPETAVSVRGGSATKPPEFRTSFGRLLPFADAGASSGFVQVWLNDGTGGPAPTVRASQSRRGNVRGSFIDGNPATYAVTFDGTKRGEDWYALQWRKPVAVRTITFRHGKTFHDGGWFDTSTFKVRVQVLRRPEVWEDIATFPTYPQTTATDAAGLVGGEAFEVTLPAAVRVRGVRVVGVPATGDSPTQSFSSCAELSVRQ